MLLIAMVVYYLQNCYKFYMAKKLSYERYLWFHGKLKRNRYPTIANMSERFEISYRQSAREVEFMRDFFRAPIEYDREEKGYYYSDKKFELPGLWTADEEIITLLIAKKISGMIPGEKRKERFKVLVEKILNETGIDIDQIEKHFSVKNVRYAKVIPAVFESVLYSFLKRKKIKIIYNSPYKGTRSERTINPVHMILYMGNWHLIAYCEMKGDIRDFLLSRIDIAEILEENIMAGIDEKIGKSDIYKNYGIFFSGSGEEVILKFSGPKKNIVKDQIWFGNQKIDFNKEGDMILRFPASDFRELAGDILGYGAGVEVLSPPGLRNEIRKQLEQMLLLYSDKN